MLKRIGIAVGGLLGLALLLVLGVYTASAWKLGANYAITPAPFEISSDSSALARGQHIVTTWGCRDCHGEDLGGMAFIDDPAVGRVYGSNLTSGRGGIGRTYTDVDWVRALRHGVRADGRPLVLMPSEEYYYLGDDDLGALIAYLKQLPPVDRQEAGTSLGPLGRALVLMGEVPLAAERIDHDGPRPAAPAPGVTVEYGAYLAKSCMGCHGLDYAGGPIKGAPPDWPPAANLTPHPEDGLGTWSEADFVRALREGRRPDGSEIDAIMPRAMGQLTDEELEALWMFLESLPPRPRT